MHKAVNKKSMSTNVIFKKGFNAVSGQKHFTIYESRGGSRISIYIERRQSAQGRHIIFVRLQATGAAL